MTGWDARIDAILREAKGLEEVEKTAAAEPEDLLEIANELEKIASEHDQRVVEETAVKDDLALTSNSLAKQRLKEILLEGVKGEKPTPAFQKLRALLKDKGRVKEAQAIIDHMVAQWLKKTP